MFFFPENQCRSAPQLSPQSPKQAILVILQEMCAIRQRIGKYETHKVLALGLRLSPKVLINGKVKL